MDFSFWRWSFWALRVSNRKVIVIHSAEYLNDPIQKSIDIDTFIKNKGLFCHFRNENNEI